MIKAYKLAIVYFLIFSILLIISSIVLFEQKIGISIEGIKNYYLGNEELFIPPKSILGIFKITLPHIFVFGLFSMVILHFLVFTKEKKKRVTQTVIYLMFLSAFLEIFSPIMIVLGFESFAYLKFLSFFIFEGLIIYVLYLLFFHIFYK